MHGSQLRIDVFRCRIYLAAPCLHCGRLGNRAALRSAFWLGAYGCVVAIFMLSGLTGHPAA
jgi:hypothetical protein